MVTAAQLELCLDSAAMEGKGGTVSNPGAYLVSTVTNTKTYLFFQQLTNYE